MTKSFRFIITAVFVLILGNIISAQSHEMYLPIPTEATYINKIIMGDTLANGSRVDMQRVYVLQRGGVWFFNGVIKNIGWDIRIHAEEGTGPLPIIYGIVEEGGSNVPVDFIESQGNVYVKNIAINGIFDLDPDYASFKFGAPREIIQYSVAGDYTMVVDGCIFENAHQADLRTFAGIRSLKVTNCIFANGGAAPWQSISNGRCVDIRNTSCDTLLMVNNTMINTNDRIVRHIASTARLNNFIFEHNTIINNGGRYGVLALGLIGDKVQIKNNLFIDPMAFGSDTSAKRQSDFKENGESFSSTILDKVKMPFVYSQKEDPAYATNFDIQNNYWYFSPEVKAVWDKIKTDHANLTLGVPPAMTDFITSQVSDASKAFIELSNGITFTNVPKPMSEMAYWNLRPGPEGAGENSNGGTEFRDFDRRKTLYHRDTLDCSYPTSHAAYTGGSDGYPLGDLNWFPDKKAEWEAGVKPFSITVDGNKDDFFAALTKPDDGYLQLRAYAGNDNGIPKDDADLSAKVWGAWTDSWLYLYAEVKDDTIAANATNVWEEDGLELKIDPQPTDSTNTGSSIFATGFTALAAGGTGVSKADDMANIAAADKQFNRSLTNDGYKLELGIKWTAIKANNEIITPAAGNVFGLAINFHDNDGHAKRQASVMWAAVMKDHVWDTPKYLGTAKLLADNKIQFIKINSMTGATNPVPFDGSDWTGVKQVSEIPQEFALSQNYPNPFNPSTVINFSLKETGQVSLKIYNSLGELVTTLVENEVKDAGMYTANFDASNLSTGIYVYVLRQGQQMLSRKMLLMK